MSKYVHQTKAPQNETSSNRFTTMAKQGDVSLTLSCNLITAFHNWRLDRSYNPSLTKRSEGWTEKWGPSTEGVDVSADCWQMEHESVALICSTAYPQVPITIFQYRPAWMEQLALRVANIPFTVVNTAHAVTEATGPLPCLRELQPAQDPVLTGRALPDGSAGNAIITYIAQSRGVDLDVHLQASKKLQAQSKLYANLIQQSLEPALNILRYQDWEAWHQVYRSQCLHASTGVETNSFWLRLPGWWQTWSERVQHKASLSIDARSRTNEQAVQQAHDAYQVLEDRLQSQEATLEGDSYLLGSPKPTTVDLLLWDHLMQALTDVHLVVVLADFPVLCRYVQRIWDRHFTMTGEHSPEEWKLWNAQENSRNAFVQLPMLSKKSKDDESQSFQDALELMEQLSVRTHDLHESVELAKLVRSRENALRPRYRPFHTWNRWRLGDQLYPTRERPQHADATSGREEEMKKEFRRNDEVWMTSVGVVTFLTAVTFAISAGSR